MGTCVDVWCDWSIEEMAGRSEGQAWTRSCRALYVDHARGQDHFSEAPSGDLVKHPSLHPKASVLKGLVAHFLHTVAVLKLHS